MYVVSVTVTGRSEIFDTDDAYGAAGSELTTSYVMRCFSSEISSTWEDRIHTLKSAKHVKDIRTIGVIAGIELNSREDAPGKRAYEVFVKCFEAAQTPGGDAGASGTATPSMSTTADGMSEAGTPAPEATSEKKKGGILGSSSPAASRRAGRRRRCSNSKSTSTASRTASASA